MTLLIPVRAHQEFKPERYVYAGVDSPDIKLRVEEDIIILETWVASPRFRGGSAELVSDMPPFQIVKNLWEVMGVGPENISSFREIVGEELWERFIKVTMALVDRAYDLGRFDEAHEILRRITHYERGESFYKLDDAAKLSRSSLLYCGFSTYEPSVFGRLFADLQEFLRADVTAFASVDEDKRELNYDRISFSCWKNDADVRFEVETPVVVHVKEGEGVDIPVRFTSNTWPEDVDVFWHVMHPDFGTRFDNCEGQPRQITFEPEPAGDYASTPYPSYCAHRPTPDNPDGGAVPEGELPFGQIRYHRHGSENRTFSVYQRQTTVKATLPLKVKFKAGEDRLTHRQRAIPIIMEFVPRYMPEHSVKRFVIVKVDNPNEAPSVKITAPAHVNEGEEVCFRAESGDPENDELVRGWSFGGENAAELSSASRVADNGDLCVRTHVTNQFALPLDVTLRVKDVINPEEHPTLRSESASASARVYIDPLTIALPTGEEIKPSPELVEKMSDPETKDVLSGVLATDKYMYVLLHLPAPVGNFDLPTPPPTIASGVSIYGGGAITAWAPRPWSPFVKVQSATSVAMSYSPLRRWTEGGRQEIQYDLTVADRHGRFSAPLAGTVQIDSPDINVRVGMDEDCRDGTCNYHLRLTNAMDPDGREFIRAPDRLPVSVTVEQTTKMGRIELTSTVEGIRRTIGRRGELVYDIPVTWPAAYLAPSASATLRMELTNRFGESAIIQYSPSLGDFRPRASSFDLLRFELDPHPMPDPWFLMHIGGLESAGLRADELLSGLQADLRICPQGEMKSFIRDCTHLDNLVDWNRISDRNDAIRLPLRPRGHHAVLASAYRAIGGPVTGRLELKLPSNAGGSRSAGRPWRVAIQFRSADLSLPPDPTVKVDREEIFRELFDAPENVVLALFTLVGKFEALLKSKGMFSTKRRSVGPGDEFHVDITIPRQNEEAVTTCTSSSQCSRRVVRDDSVKLAGFGDMISELEDLVSVELKPAGDGRMDLYTLRPVSVTRQGFDKLRLTFRVPTYLPGGGYSAEMSTALNVYADYIFAYVHQSSDQRWEKKIPVVIWDSDTLWEVSDLKIAGDPQISPPSATAEVFNPAE